MEISLLAEDAPMSSPPTGPTASDLLRVVEEIQERKRQLDLTLLGTMPNVIAGHALRICQSHAECEGRSARLVMVPADIAARIPPRLLSSLYGKEGKDVGLVSSVERILKPLMDAVVDILGRLGYTCTVSGGKPDEWQVITISW